jgi:hypothetical protein
VAVVWLSEQLGVSETVHVDPLPLFCHLIRDIAASHVNPGRSAAQNIEQVLVTPQCWYSHLLATQLCS